MFLAYYFSLNNILYINYKHKNSFKLKQPWVNMSRVYILIRTCEYILNSVVFEKHKMGFVSEWIAYLNGCTNPVVCDLSLSPSVSLFGSGCLSLSVWHVFSCARLWDFYFSPSKSLFTRQCERGARGCAESLCCGLDNKPLLLLRLSSGLLSVVRERRFYNIFLQSITGLIQTLRQNNIGFKHQDLNIFNQVYWGRKCCEIGIFQNVLKCSWQTQYILHLCICFNWRSLSLRLKVN